jgi:hypothetical protein
MLAMKLKKVLRFLRFLINYQLQTEILEILDKLTIPIYAYLENLDKLAKLITSE